MCQEYEDEYETGGEFAVLNINTRDIFSGNKTSLYGGTKVASDDSAIGALMNFGSKIVIFNIDFEKIMGDMFQRYTIFSIDLKVIKTIYTDVVNSLRTQQYSTFRNVNVFLEGLDFITNNGVLNTGRAHLTNLSTVYNGTTNEPYDTSTSWDLTQKFITEIQTDDSKLYFKKHYGKRPFIISLGTLLEVEPLGTEYDIITGAWQIAPPFYFKFLIRPVE